MWENSLEKLKILNYERDYCKKLNKKPFSRVHFVIPGVNASHQFTEFVSICSWLCTSISRKVDTFKPEEFDDPNTIVNKLMLALRSFDFKASFPAQKLKVANGEFACMVLEFLTDKALEELRFEFAAPQHTSNDEVYYSQCFQVFFVQLHLCKIFPCNTLVFLIFFPVSIQIEQAEADEENEDEDIIEDDAAGGPDEEVRCTR